jgi:hypothetical protein
MRLLHALALAALLAPFAQASSAIRGTGTHDGGLAVPDNVMVATAFTAAPSASIPFKVPASGEVRFQLRVGAADGHTLAVLSPSPCRQTVEAGAGALLTFACSDLLAGQYTLRLRSGGQATAGTLKATGATFGAPTTPV